MFSFESTAYPSKMNLPKHSGLALSRLDRLPQNWGPRLRRCHARVFYSSPVTLGGTVLGYSTLVLSNTHNNTLQHIPNITLQVWTWGLTKNVSKLGPTAPKASPINTCVTQWGCSRITDKLINQVKLPPPHFPWHSTYFQNFTYRKKLFLFFPD